MRWIDGWETPRIWVRGLIANISRKAKKWEKGGWTTDLDRIGDRSHGSEKAESARHSR